MSHSRLPDAAPPAPADPHGPGPVDPGDQPQALRLAADVLRAVRGHWRIAGLFFVLANAAVLAGIMVCPRTYESQAMLRVNPGRETSTLDPTAQVSGQVITAQTNREQDLNTAVDILQSRAVMEYAVSRIGPEPILKGYVPEADEVGDDAGGVLDPEVAQRVDAGPLAAMGLSDPVSRYEKAVQTLTEIVDVDSNKKSDVVSVSVEAEKPRLAQRICREVVAGFRRKYQDASEIEGGSEFFAQKATETKRDLDAAATALATELNKLGISSVEGRRRQLQDELSRQTTDELDRRKQLAATVAEIAGYERVLAATPETIDAGSTANQATGAPDTLRRALADLEAARATLVEKYGERVPAVTKLDGRIASAEASLTKIQNASDQTVTAPNPVHQNLLQSQLTAEAKAESLRAELETLGRQLADVQAAVAALNDRESTILALQTERDELSKGLAKYVEKREQARVSDEMGARSISSVKVFQAPTFNAKPVAPKKRLIAAAGLVFAAFGALGLCLVLEYKSVFFPADDPHAGDPHAGDLHAADGGADGYAPAAANGYHTAEPAAALRNGSRNGHPDPAPGEPDAADEPLVVGRPR